MTKLVTGPTTRSKTLRRRPRLGRHAAHSAKRNSDAVDDGALAARDERVRELVQQHRDEEQGPLRLREPANERSQSGCQRGKTPAPRFTYSPKMRMMLQSSGSRRRRGGLTPVLRLERRMKSSAYVELMGRSCKAQAALTRARRSVPVNRVAPVRKARPTSQTRGCDAAAATLWDCDGQLPLAASRTPAPSAARAACSCCRRDGGPHRGGPRAFSGRAGALGAGQAGARFRGSEGALASAEQVVAREPARLLARVNAALSPFACARTRDAGASPKLKRFAWRLAAVAGGSSRCRSVAAMTFRRLSAAPAAATSRRLVQVAAPVATTVLAARRGVDKQRSSRGGAAVVQVAARRGFLRGFRPGADQRARVLRRRHELAGALA